MKMINRKRHFPILMRSESAQGEMMMRYYPISLQQIRMNCGRLFTLNEVANWHLKVFDSGTWSEPVVLLKCWGLSDLWRGYMKCFPYRCRKLMFPMEQFNRITDTKGHMIQYGKIAVNFDFKKNNSK